MKIFLGSIEAGFLHTDAHQSNWFIELELQLVYPRIVLGDWAMNIPKPTDVEDTKDLDKWFQAAYSEIHVRVIEEIRVFVRHGTYGTGIGTSRDWVDN